MRKAHLSRIPREAIYLSLPSRIPTTAKGNDRNTKCSSGEASTTAMCNLRLSPEVAILDNESNTFEAVVHVQDIKSTEVANALKWT